MNTHVLFSQALGLGSGWKVVKNEMNVADGELKLWLDFEPGSLFACPKCEKFCPVHDTVEKKWRHLDFWQHRTMLIARVPRTMCEEHGVLQTPVPWARSGSGFTLMAEAVILLLCQEMSVSAAARHLGEDDKRLWRVLDHYVRQAHAAKDWSQVRRLMIDETSARKGHRYVTCVLEAESHELLLMVEGRSANAVAQFVAAMPAHGAQPQQITEVVMDMSPSYISGVKTHFPNARIVFDLFHIMKLAGEALDRVRKDLRKEGADLKDALWAVRGNEWTRSQEQLALRRSLSRTYPQLGRAIALRESLQEVLADGDLESIHWWLGWADRSRLAPFRKLSRTLKDHFHGILAYLDTRLTNAAIEAVNGILQMAKRIARGFRNFHYFRISAYLRASRLNLPSLYPLPTDLTKWRKRGWLYQNIHPCSCLVALFQILNGSGSHFDFESERLDCWCVWLGVTSLEECSSLSMSVSSQG
jgi:transposase